MKNPSSEELVELKSAGVVHVKHEALRFMPYEHQSRAMECLDRINKLSSFSTLVVLPTGGGKTLTASVWLLKNAIGKGFKVLWIAHRQFLLDQAASAFQSNAYEAYLPRKASFRYRIVSGSGEHSRTIDIGAGDTLLIAGKDSLGQNLDSLKGWLKDEETLFVVIDEAHHATAKTYRRILDYIAKRVPHLKIIGLTATPMRTAKEEAGLLAKIFRDGIKNGRVVQGDIGIAYEVSLKELIGRQILARPRLNDIGTGENFGESLGLDAMERIQRLDIIPEDIAEGIAKNAARNRLIVDTYLNNRRKYGQTIVFALNIEHAIALRALFAKAGVKAGIVVSTIREIGTGATIDGKENKRVIRDYEDGKLDVLVNVNILTEGVDLPKTQSVFLARPTVSKILMTQMIGRALRGVKAGGTTEANIVAFMDNWRDRINWVNPESVFDEGDADFAENEQEHFKGVVRWISVAKIEEFARMMDASLNADDRAIASLPFVERIPIGMYVFSYQEQGEGGDEGADCQAQIMVYNSTRDAYGKFMKGLPALFRRHREASAEYLSKTVLRKLADECESKFFTDDMVPPYDRRDIESVLKFYAQKESVPRFYPFADIDRERLDITGIARKIVDEDMGPRRERAYLDELWDNGDDDLLRLFFAHRSYFITQVQIEENKLIHPDFYSLDEPCVSHDKVPLENLTLYQLREVAPERARRIADKVFSASMNQRGEYVCQKCGRTSKTRRGLHLDHIVPMARGGKTKVENLQVLCASCNMRKGAK